MTRKQALLSWAKTILNNQNCTIQQASSDASFRSYWRIFSYSDTFILMDAPPQHEDCIPFIDVSKRLSACGILVPTVLQQDLELGFLLLSDLGSTQYLSVLNSSNCMTLYSDAIERLLHMQQNASIENLPLYTTSLLQQELCLFSDWFIKTHLGVHLDSKQIDILETTQQLLINNALEQPQTFVHRDYHSRNLMKSKVNNPGVLDFQDAVIGAVTYDLVSLLKDCYISWDPQIVLRLSDAFRIKYNQNNPTQIESKQWQRWFDLMGIQRHLKAIGIFCRLNYRDHKPNYLKDINRTLCYIINACSVHKDLQPFLNLVHEISPNMDKLCKL